MDEKHKREFIDRITKDLVDHGLLIEAGWEGLKLVATSPDTTKAQLDTMRDCFFAGAQHLFSTVMSVMDADREPTEKDLERMDQIHKELGRFLVQYKRRHKLP